MSLLIKIFCGIIAIILSGYGIYTKCPDFNKINVLHGTFVKVLWRISLTSSGLALWLLVWFYPEWSDTQKLILIGITCSVIITFVVIIAKVFDLDLGVRD